MDIKNYCAAFSTRAEKARIGREWTAALRKQYNEKAANRKRRLFLK